MIVNKNLTFGKLGIVTTTVATVGFILGDLAPANATFIDIALTGLIDSGDLINTSYAGTFRFPEPPSTNFTGTMPVDPLSITFTTPPPYYVSTFTQADAVTPPVVEYSNGNLLGLEFAVNGAEIGPGMDGDPGRITFDFAFVPGFPEEPVTEAALFYDVEDGIGGSGTANFEVVPEPTTMLGSLGILGLLGYHKRKRNK